MKVALVYDRINKWGGAERVLLALHELFPDAPLYTSVYNPKKAPWANVFNIKTSFLQNFPYASTNHELLALLMPVAFESFSFDEYDLVISVTSEAAKGIITKPSTKHICYCLTPTRYLWSGYDEYFNNKMFKVISTLPVAYLRTWDKLVSSRPDIFVAISGEVRYRINKYYGLVARIIYPPLFIKKNGRKVKKEDYFLIVSRLVPYKRIDLAIAACNELQVPLKIIGTGSIEDELKSMAGDSIEFLGNVTDSVLINYYKKCKALIFPGKEDFGLTMIEAESFGKPVIAFEGGGALEIVKHGKTGLLFNKQIKNSLKSAILNFDKNYFDPSVCERSVDKFSFNNFKKNFLSLVEKVF